MQFNLNCNKMNKKNKKIQIVFRRDSAFKKILSIDKESLELFAQIMRDRYGEI